MTQQRNLIRAAAVGSLWNYSAFAVSKLLIFISTVVLVRLLTKEDFGLLALGLVMINYMDRLSGVGVDLALIRHRGDDPDRVAGVALVTGFVVDGTMAACAFLAAPLVAGFFSEPRLTPIIQVLAVGFFIGSLKSVPEARLKRKLDFKRRFAPELVRSFAKGAIAVTLAATGFGVWSLVWAQFATNAVAAVMYWAMSDWKPRLVLDTRIARALIGFGAPLAVLQLMGVFSGSIDYLIVGKRMGAQSLGVYTVAFRLPELIIISICYVLSHVLFSAYSNVQHRPDAMKRGFLMTMRYTSLITVPLGVGIFLVAPEFVRLLYGRDWEATIVVMQVLALFAMVDSINSNDGEVFKACGKLSILYKVWCLNVVLMAPVLWWAAGHSLLHVAVGELAVMAVMTSIQLTLVSRFLSIRPIEIARALSPAFTAALVMFAATYLLKAELVRVLEGGRIAQIVSLMVMVATGALVYMVTLWLTHREIFAQALLLLRPKDATAS